MALFILSFVIWIACLVFNIWGFYQARKYRKKGWMLLNVILGLWSAYNLAHLTIYVWHVVKF